MGQVHGKAAYIKATAPFLNASEKDVNKLWEAFNDVAEGFGLNQDEVCEIARSLMPTLEIYAKADMDQLTIPLFTAFDTDENGLVDALEFLGTIAVMSAMTVQQKLTFVYNCYDFNESGQISIDELTLALRSTLTGLCKLSTGLLCPTEMVLEDIALHAFHKSQKHGPDDYITLVEFLKFAETTPEMTSWIDYFDCPDDAALAGELERDDSDVELENTAVHPFSSDDLAKKRDPSFPIDAKAPAFDSDELVAVQPWQAVVANATPSAPPTINPNAPAASLELDWIYGFNSDLRNVAKYVTPGEIVYPAGAVAVLYDVLEHKQRFACHHSDLVQCIAVHPLHRHVLATGERGAQPKIIVWSTQSLGATLAVVRGFHRLGVAHLAWMPNGRTLVSIGQDPFHCVAVYQWETTTSASSVEWSRPPTLLFADRCGPEPVHALAVLSATQFATAGRRHLLFWSRESDERYATAHALFYKRPGVLGRKSKVQSLLSLSPMAGDASMLLAGSARGHVLVFHGRNCVKLLHAHASAVTVLQSFPGGVLSGGRDGKVRLWSKRMEPGAQFDVEALGSVASSVRSVVASPDGGAKLLVATAGAELFEIAASDGSNLHFGAMLSGHFAGQLHGLAVHPAKREVATCGDDRSVRVWDLATHRQSRMTLLDAPSRCAGYSPDGALLAVGQGAPEEGEGGGGGAEGRPSSSSSSSFSKLINVNKQGAFAVLSEATLAVKYEAKDSKKHIVNIKFSGDGLTLGVSSHDAFLFAYNTDDWASKGKCKARDAAAVLSAFDFSATGEYVMANARNKGEMVFFEASSGVEITRIATLKDVEWLTTSCPFGWGVQGAWGATASRSIEVTAVGRGGGGSSGPLLAVGDALGRLRVYRYPCVSPLAVPHTVAAASSPLTRVAFTSDNAFVVATAQDERCVYQWKVEYEEEDFAATLGADGVSPGGAVPSLEEHPTSDDEEERSHGIERTPFDEAAAAGDFAIELLHQVQGGGGGGGEEGTVAASTPVKPWVASAVAPADAPDEKDLELSTVPSESLELEWVYGYRCHDARNNVLASRAKSWLVYPAARVVVVLDTKLWLQRHFKQHTDEVTAVAIHTGAKKRSSGGGGGGASRPPSSTAEGGGGETWLSSAEVVASGQMGRLPVIHVWRLDTLELLVSLRGFHRHGIAELRFNPTGALLVTVGLDPTNAMAVYDWQSGVVLASASTTAAPGRVLGVAFQQEPTDATGTMLCTVGVKQLTFWRLTGSHQLVKKDALLGKKGLLQTFLSVVYCGKDAVVGTTSGELYRFKGVELAAIVPAHQRKVAALFCVAKPPFQLVSGGADGVVKLWSADLECLAEFSEFNAASRHAIRSVALDVDKNLLVVGTRGGCIHLLSSVDGGVVTPRTPDGTPVVSIEAHFRHELHGLSVCPSKERCATAGDDAVLRVWDLSRHVLVLAKALDTSARACAYSYDGDLIAVGLGGGHSAKRHKKDGSVVVFEDRGGSVELVYETRDTKQGIAVVAFSPDGQSLVAGALDHSVYIYDVPGNYAKRAVFSKHKSWLTHVDVSCDSQYLRSNCGGGELLFADVTTGSHVASASALKNQKWDTCSTVYNWANHGAWPSSATEMAVTASAASLPDSHQDIRKAVLAVGTSHGTIHLLKYPAFVPGAGFKSFSGHHGPVSRLAFASHGQQCVSIGASDRCLLQWRKTRPQAVPEEEEDDAMAKDLDEDEDIVLEGRFIPEAFVNAPVPEIKPFLSAIMPPSAELLEPSDKDGLAASTTFTLEHVFGFRAYDVRSAAAYSKTKHVVFPAGCLGVQYDRRSHTQQFYAGHSRPIVSLAASINGSFVATGEICSEHLQRERPRIHVWEPASCQRVVALSAFHTKAVSYLAFGGTSSKLLAAVGQDEYHSLAVYHSPSALWFDGALLASSKTTRQPVYFVACLDSTTQPYHVVTGGKDHVIFWRLDAPSLIATHGVFGAKAQRQSVLCGAALGSAVVTGGLSGHLYVWESSVVTRAVPAHDGAVYSIHSTPLGCVSGGRDGHVKVWSPSLSPLSSFSLLDAKPAVHQPAIRSVHWDTAEDRVLVGTRGGEVLELSRLTNETSLVTDCHADHTELVALATHPLRPELVATAGGDATVRVWDLTKRCVLVKLALDGSLRCIAYSPDGKTLAVGFGGAKVSTSTKDGAFVVLDALTLEILHEGRDSKQSLLCAQFSPDLTLLAVGSADHSVLLYSTLDNYALRFKFTKATGQVQHVDFASDSSALRLNSDAYELLFVSTLDGSAITTSSSVKDTVWATHSCVFAYDVQGIWDFAQESEHIHAVAKAHSKPLLASATNQGEVRVYNYPCLSKHTQQHVLKGHALNVASVAFTCDDARLVSIGTHDKSLLVWKLA